MVGVDLCERKILLLVASRIECNASSEIQVSNHTVSVVPYDLIYLLFFKYCFIDFRSFSMCSGCIFSFLK